MTDCVLKTIECSRDPALGKSQAIIRRLRKRQLYKLVDTILLPKAIDAKVRKVARPCALHCVPHKRCLIFLLDGFFFLPRS